MTVRADGSVRVKAPALIPWEDVLAFVRSRLDWVREKRAFFAEHRGVTAPAREGSAALYLGRTFTLRPVPALRNARAHFRGENAGAALPAPRSRRRGQRPRRGKSLPELGDSTRLP